MLKRGGSSALSDARLERDWKDFEGGKRRRLRRRPSLVLMALSGDDDATSRKRLLLESVGEEGLGDLVLLLLLVKKPM